MRSADYLRTASHNLLRQKSRTFLTIVAITIGSLSLILMTSLILSVHQSLIDQFEDFGAFDLVTVIKDPNSVDDMSLLGSRGDPSEGKKIDDATLTSMGQLPHVIEATGIVNSFGIQTMRLADQPKKTWASLVAYDPTNDVFDLAIAFGRKLTTTDLDKIVVGSRFAEEMGYLDRPQELIGQKVLLNYRWGGGSGPDWGDLPAKPPINADREWYEAQGNKGIEIPAEIVGVTAGGLLDDGQSYITLAWGRRLMTNVSWQMSGGSGPDGSGFSYPKFDLVKEDQFVTQGYGSLILRADTTAEISTIASAVKQLGYGATTAQTMLDQINQILAVVGIVLATIGGISLFVATIGIVNTMIMATYERIREIGVMRACGATRSTIRRLFTVEAALLGFWGGVFGMLISLALGQIARWLVRNQGAGLSSLPIENIGQFPLWLVGAVLGFTTILGILSGLFPAIRAARMNPVDALRYE